MSVDKTNTLALVTLKPASDQYSVIVDDEHRLTHEQTVRQVSSGAAEQCYTNTAEEDCNDDIKCSHAGVHGTHYDCHTPYSEGRAPYEDKEQFPDARVDRDCSHG